jgi:prepilin-type processing-associated H-X9-DG protein
MYPDGRRSWDSRGSQFGVFFKICPYLEQQSVYDALVEAEKGYRGNIAFASSWAGTDAAKLRISQAACGAITPLLCPSDDYGWSKDGGAVAMNNYRAVTGDLGTRHPEEGMSNSRGVFGNRVWFSMAAITDGTSNTVAFSERGISDGTRKIKRVSIIPTGWSNDWGTGDQVTNFAYDVCLNTIDTGSDYNTELTAALQTNGGRRWYCGMQSYGCVSTIMPPNGPSCAATNNDGSANTTPPSSYHSGGVNASRVDGSVQFVSDTINTITSGLNPTTAKCKKSGESSFGAWGALGTRDGGESTTL